MKNLIITVLAFVTFTTYAGIESGGGGGTSKAMISNENINFTTSFMTFDINKISDIQLIDGSFVSPSKAAIISKNIEIVTENLFINIKSKDVFDVQMKDGRTCVILDNNCY